MKKTLTLILGIFLLGSILHAQSTFDKVLFDFDLPPDNGYGVHGVAVAPDGNVWLALFGNMAKDTIFTPANDTLIVIPIYVLDPATGNHVSFSPIRFLVWPDATIDTILGSARGIEVANDGNLIITGPLGANSLVKMDYKTGKPLAKWLNPIAGSMTEAVQSKADGNIYVGHVVPSGKATYLLDQDFNLIGNAIESTTQINRTYEVSEDGKDLYTGSIYNGVGIRHFHSDAPGLTQFEEVGSFGNWTNVQGVDTVYESIKLWVSCLDFGPDGLLWAGMLDDGESNGHGKGSQWYGFDAESKTLVRTIGTPMGDKNAGGFFRPRGAAWSPDGSKMYLADFNYNNVVVYNYEAWVKPDSIDLSVTYEADMELEFLKGGFDPATDTLEVRGAFFGWGSEAPDMEQSATDPNKYTYTTTQRATVGDKLPDYKFFYTVGNWEGGDNRSYKVTQEDYDNGYAVVARAFNDASLATVINQDSKILFTVATAGAISSINNAAFTAVNTVHITGAVTPLRWPDGGWPDAQLDRMIPMFDDGTNGDVTAGDGIFSANVTFPQYTGFRIQYKYGINYGDAANNQGGNDNENGVGADHFIDLTADLASAKVENTFGTMGNHTLIDVVKAGASGMAVTFEDGGMGADWSWTTFAPDAAPVAVIANPDMSGPNTSSKVLQFTAKFPGDPWAGLFTDDIGEFTFDEKNSTVKVMVWKPVMSNFGVKFEGATQIEKLIPNTVTSAWEELTFDFTDQIGKTFKRLVFLPDFGPGTRTQDNIVYIDNLTFSAKPTGVEQVNQLPTGFELTQNYPNPFNPSTTINFQIPSSENVTLKVYNLLGQQVATLVNEQMGAGVYEVGFDASQLSSGVYIYSLKAGSFNASKKMTILK